jgi:hypothetical protein
MFAPDYDGDRNPDLLVGVSGLRALHRLPDGRFWQMFFWDGSVLSDAGMVSTREDRFLPLAA